MKVGHWKEVEPQVFEGEDVKAVKRVLIGRKFGAPNYVMRLFTLPVGGFTPFHSHPWEHEVFVLKGRVRLKGDGEEYILEEGNFALVMPNEKHGFENIGDGEAMFICVIPNSGGE